MQFEHHPQGISTSRPAVLIRLGQDTPQAQRGRVEDGVCPQCGKSGYDCCKNQDSVQISDESRKRYELIAQHQPQSEATPTATSDVAADMQTNMQNPAETVIESSNTSANNNGEEQYNDQQASSEKQSDQSGSSNSGSDKELSESEKKEVQELQQRDQEVKTHEQAHLAAAGHLATSGADYEYETGPDGKRYATGGEVDIRFGGNTPEERLKNAEQAVRAALAPAEPSPQDRQIASDARRAANEARQEIEKTKRNKNNPETKNKPVAQPADANSEPTKKTGATPNFLNQQNPSKTEKNPLETSPQSPLEKENTDQKATERAASAYQAQSNYRRSGSLDLPEEFQHTFARTRKPGAIFSAIA